MAEMESRQDTAARGLRWVHVAGLGVAFAISGSFSGWNVGLGLGGWGGMLIAAAIMACFYLCLSQCVAELGAAHPAAQGMDSYAAVGLGPAAGYVAGMSVALPVAVTAGACVNFIAAYCQPVLGVGGWDFKLALLAVLLAVQLRGAREAVSLTTAGGLFSAAVLLLFCAALLPAFKAAELYSGAGATRTLLPHGAFGVFECIPYALFMFFGVEQAANAAGEMERPSRDLPKALLAAVAIVLAIGVGILVFATGAAGIAAVAAADGNPLYVAAQAGLRGSGGAWLGNIVGAGSIVSLTATAFSLTYAASRQFHALARAGSLPRRLEALNASGAPAPALWLVALLALAGMALDTNAVLVCFVFSLNVCNALVLASFLRLRRVQPALRRPYRAIGGQAAAIAALLLALLVLGACIQLQPGALAYVALAYLLMAAHYLSVRGRAAAVRHD